MKNRTSVFVSYSHRDAAQKKWVERLVAAMSKLDLDVWHDVSSIRPGDDIRTSLENGLRKSDAVVAIFSKDDLNRPNVMFELGATIGMGKKLIPVVMQSLGLHDLPLDLAQRRIIFASDPERTAKEVAAAILPSVERKTAIRSPMAATAG